MRLLTELQFCPTSSFPLTKKETLKKTTRYCGLFAIFRLFPYYILIAGFKILKRFSNETFLTYLDLN